MVHPEQEKALPTLLVRHARAEDDHPAGDFERALTADGRAIFKKHAKLLSRQTRLLGVVTSPLVRAVQTAEILAEAFGVLDVVVRPELAPGQRAARKIAALAEELGPGWALVGHNPSLLMAASRALGKDADGLRLKKGAALCLRRDGRELVFQWLFTPGEPVRRALG